jgi:hypothetical protein
MVKYKFTQFGTFSVITMLPILIFIVIMIFTIGLKDPVQGSIFIFVGVTFLICLLLFYKLTICIDDTFITLSLGIGLITKKYPLSDIKSCKPVRNSPFYGIGIRMIPNGWLYNVSGLGAVELTFKNKKSVVRIGSNDPGKVSDIINRMTNAEESGSVSYKKDFTGYALSVILILLVLIMPAIIILTGNLEPVVKTAGESLEINGMYGLTVRYSDILQLDTIPDLPAIRRRTNGYEFGRILKGNFTLSDRTKVKLFVKKGNPPYIHIKTNDLIIYLNLKNPGNTINLYEQIITAREK